MADSGTGDVVVLARMWLDGVDAHVRPYHIEPGIVKGLLDRLDRCENALLTAEDHGFHFYECPGTRRSGVCTCGHAEADAEVAAYWTSVELGTAPEAESEGERER